MFTEKTQNLYQIIYTYVDGFFAKINITSRDVIVYVTSFGIGFLLGVAFKKYGKWIVSVGISVVLCVTILQHFNLITVHHDKIKTLLGLQNVHSYQVLIERSKKYVIEITIGCIGLLLGFKLG